MKQSDGIILKSEPVAVQNISVGLSEKNILMMFNKNGEADPEYACTLPVDKLKELISLLYQCGVSYEKEYHKYIGFGTESEG